MNDKSEVEPRNNNRDLSIRSAAIDMAIRSNSGSEYDAEGRIVTNADRIVEAAKKFENFIKGNIDKSLPPKENW